MEVIYEVNVLEEIDKAIAEAEEEGNKVKKIVLTYPEWKRLIKLLSLEQFARIINKPTGSMLFYKDVMLMVNYSYATLVQDEPETKSTKKCDYNFFPRGLLGLW